VKDSDVRFLVDAGPLVGAFWPADQWHAWSRKVLSSVGGPVYTTETVFAEAAYHLNAHVPALLQLLATLETGLVRLISIDPACGVRAAEFITRYASCADWGDTTLFILSERYPRARLVTIDVRDFAIYRRRDGRPVPCITPQNPV
jgi:predicted nucleic acid-binding protein